MSPVLRLKRLSDSELLALVLRLTALHGEYHGYTPAVTEEQMVLFLTDSLSRAGAETMITPREIIRDYVTLLDLLLTNPDRKFEEIFSGMTRTTADPAQADETTADSGPLPSPGAKITMDDLEF